LSRVTSIQGLFLIEKFNQNAIIGDKKSKQEYEYLRHNQSIGLDNGNVDCGYDFTLTL